MSTYEGAVLDAVAYTAVATVQGGRQGSASSSNPELSLSLDTPQAMGGKGAGTNPEQLFAVGWGACFQGAMALAAKEQRISASLLESSQVRCAVSIGPEGESFAIAAQITVALPDLDLEQAERLVERTHALCPYSKATAGNVSVALRVVQQLD